MTPRGIAAIAAAEPTRVAIVDGERVVSFGELDARANQVAWALHRLGVEPGDRVAVRAHNCAELFAVWFGITRLGAVVVPVGYRLAPPEVAWIVGDSGSVVLLHDDDRAVLGEAADLPALRAVLHIADAGLWRQPTTPPRTDFLGTPVSLMSYTSGTTGRPKGIRRAPPAPTSQAPRWPIAEFWGFGPDDVHLLCGPAYHTAPGAYAQMSLVEGGRVVVMQPFDAEECLRLIERHRVTTSHMVPANFVRILEVDWQRYDLGSVRRILHAAAPCPVSVKRRIMEVFPAEAVWEYYGASEGIATVIGPQEWREHPGSVGRPFPGIEVRILDDQGRELAPGEVGTVYVSAREGHRFEYHNDPEKTRAAWRGDLFTVGDVGYLDSDGYLFLVDRRADLVIRGGVNIYPAEVEAALADHPDVVDSIVIGLPDERLGQRVHALVEMRSGAARDSDALRSFLQGRLADYKIPETVEFVDRLEREPTGKVSKVRLRERLASERRAASGG